MKTIGEIFRSLIGLFLDDEFLAIAILGVVALTAFLAIGLEIQPRWAGSFLLIAIVLVLVGSVLRTAWNNARRD
ncbi:hypothetical protein [Hyphomicrobium sp.]|uniref:hypothetical protein n=1 Tax=Hyphomicrobium sp. TaxID=82 RepID=UPI001D28E9E0|nr:hypothetical protein [Hyphomicrobium sp.]MBY0561407.1 hypothetical protein [Hyphomicrobium sp.]